MTLVSCDGQCALSLVADHALSLEIESSVSPLVERWLPWGLDRLAPTASAVAKIVVGASTVSARHPDGPATLALGPARGWLDPEQNFLRLHGVDAASTAVVDLAAHHAIIAADPSAPRAGADVYSMLTISAALLLAGLGRALVHAGGVVSPDGEAWLLVGDARAGKSTTCANLVRAGWGYLSDDQVVLACRPTGVVVEGWLRPFHLDRDWDKGTTSEARTEFTPAELAPDGWRRTAPLAGLLFPRVRPERPTKLAALSAAEALAGIVRQSPWLLAWRQAAPAVLALLEQAVSAARAYRLELGLDTYRDGQPLAAWLTAPSVVS